MKASRSTPPIPGVRRLGLACVVMLALTVRARAEEPPAEAPPIDPWRYGEDYSYLDSRNRGSDDPGAWWEAFKRRPIAGDRVRLDFGLELRAKYEVYENDRWGGVPDSDHDYFWNRAMPYASLQIDERFRVFTQMIFAFEGGDEAGVSPIDENRADFLQGFAELTFDVGEAASLRLRAGRQMLAYGSERLVSTRYGPNVPLAYDTAQARLEIDRWRLDLLYGSPVDSDPGEFNDSSSDDVSFWTAYATRELDFGDRSGLDLYYIGFESEEASFNQGTGDEDRHTFGARFFGAHEAWDWNFELFGQVGQFEGGDIRAWSAASDSGYTLRDVALTPRLGLKANVISGDDDPDDSDLETFNPLFPNGKYFGEIGILGPYNMINLHPSVRLSPSAEWTVDIGSVLYWRESTDDGIYDNGGFLLRPDGSSDARFIGSQFDLAATYKPTRTFDVTFAYSALVAGGFIEDTGRDDTVHFATLEFRFLF